MAQTNQYGLRQWEREEVPRHGDFNQAMAGVDSALARVAETAAGLVTKLDGTVTGKLAEINQNAAQLAADIEALDTGKAKITTGTYRGDGTSIRDILLGTKPRAVLLEMAHGKRSSQGELCGGLAFPDSPLTSNAKGNGITIIENGFRVYFESGGVSTNQSAQTYLYLALV